MIKPDHTVPLQVSLEKPCLIRVVVKDMQVDLHCIQGTTIKYLGIFIPKHTYCDNTLKQY